MSVSNHLCAYRRTFTVMAVSLPLLAAICLLTGESASTTALVVGGMAVYSTVITLPFFHRFMRWKYNPLGWLGKGINRAVAWPTNALRR